MKESDLLRMRKDIDEAKVSLSKLEGSKQTLMDQLEKTWGCSDVHEAEVKLSSLKKKADKLTSQIAEGLQAIEDKYLTE